MYKVIVTYELVFLAFWNILYLSNSNVENWFTENHSNGKVDKIVVKRRLIDWQKRSRFGFSDTMNGNERHPKFNLVPKPE